MVNPGVHGYIKTPNQRKISEKRKRTTCWKPKYMLSGGLVLHLADQGSQIDPHPSRQLLHCNKYFKY